MKIKSTFLGICVALSVLAAGIRVQARSIDAFSSFHVQVSTGSQQNAYTCVQESYGAVVNKCTYEVRLAFELPVDNDVVHTVSVQNYVKGTGTTGANCSVWSYDGNGNGQAGKSLTFSPNGQQTLNFTSILFGNNISLLCHIPVGEGIGAITWNP